MRGNHELLGQCLLCRPSCPPAARGDVIPGRAEYPGNGLVRVCLVIAQAPDLLRIAKAYRNSLKASAHTDGAVATFHHIESVIAKAEGKCL